MPIAEKMHQMVKASPMIRKMFEEGIRLKNTYGAENVFDFTLGNPDVLPPAQVKAELQKLAKDDQLRHGYMTGRGHPHVRQAIVDSLRREHEIDIDVDLTLMSSGAAGALNVVFRSLLSPDEEIVVPSPYFVSYNLYAFNVGAKIVTVPTDDRFHLDLPAIEAALTPRTRIMLINSPNNPTGAVYHQDELRRLGRVLERASRRFGRTIYLISDEPYRRITYDVTVPSVFAVYPHTILITSYSKELSLAGERIGYLAVSPHAEDAALIASAAALANDMLYVNAPNLFQLIVGRLQGVSVDVSIYRRRRDGLCAGLRDAGYEFVMPEGAFYLFPKSPLVDDIAFADMLMQNRIVTVPGAGFGCPGYFRISYAVPDDVIRRALPGFRKAFEEAQETDLHQRLTSN